MSEILIISEPAFYLEISDDSPASLEVVIAENQQVEILEVARQGAPGVTGAPGAPGADATINADLVVFFENKLL